MISKVRDSNFELLRVICMVMIIVLHTQSHGGALAGNKIGSIDFVLSNFIESFSIVAINCYILITGFYGINSKFRLKKFFELYVQMLFYSVIISLIFCLTGKIELSFTQILKTIFPLTMQTWWFMSVFIILYILMPYINKLLLSLNQKEYTILISISILTFVIWPSIPILNPISKDNGYGLYNFILIYMCGGYISLFLKNKVYNKKILFSIYFACSIILCIFNVCISVYIGYQRSIYAYNFILVFIASIALFMFFKEINLKSIFINRISILTLGIYLIHDQPNVRDWLYKYLKYNQVFNTNMFLIYTIVIVIAIYIISSLIEYLRQFMFKYISGMRFLEKIKLKFKIIEESISCNLYK